MNMFLTKKQKCEITVYEVNIYVYIYEVNF